MPAMSMLKPMSSKWTAADVPDQSGRVAIITGANSGLGYDTAAVLAAKGAHVVLAVRNLDKGNEAADRIKKASPNAVVAVAGARPDVAGQRPQGGGRIAHELPAHRSADQQRRRDVRADAAKSPRMASRCSSAPTTSAISR